MPEAPPPNPPAPPIPFVPPDSDQPLRATYHTVLTGSSIRRRVQAPEETRKINRHCLIILDSRLHKGRWFRDIQDLVVDPAQLRLWRNERTIPLQILLDAHRKLRPHHPPDAGLASAVIVDSSPQGEDPGLTLGNGPFDRFPLSLAHAFLPTLVPTLSPTLEPLPRSLVAFSFGVGQIALAFESTPLSADSFERVVRILVPPQEHTTRTDDAALTLHASGDWIVAYRDDPRIPARVEGAFSFHARARGQRKGRPIDLVTAQDEIAFTLRRVPLNFTETLVVFAGWKYDLP